MASNRGPNAISSESYNSGSNNVSSGIGGSWGAPSSSSGPSVAAQSRMAASMPHSHINHNPVVNINGHPGAANTSGTFEKNLIMELCPPGGMKPEPPADKLANFCQSLADLNSDLICPGLLDMLEDGQPWIIRAKVLCVMDKCIEVGNDIAASTGGNNVYADFFHMCREEITPLASHSRAAVREPAKRVCKALGLDVPAFAAASGPRRTAAAPVAQPQVQAPNLLDFDDEPVGPPANVPPPVPAAGPPMPPAAQAPPAPPADNASLFGGMNVKSAAPAPAPAAPSVAPPALAPAVSYPAADFLGAPVFAPTPAAEATSTSSGLFGDMVVKPTSDIGAGKENIENSVEAPSAASGFSFMNSGSSEPNKAPSKASFDPLLNMGASNSSAPSQPQQAMAMTPQMAMVMQQQQQQILMMQAQMQQMQMGGGGQQQQQQQQQQRFMMMQQRQSSTGSIGGKTNVMGAMGGHGVATSFAFMDDPTTVVRDASNKKFDFVQDAMKGAK